MCSLESSASLAQRSGVQIAKQISTSGRKAVSDANKRKGTRFVISPTFPLKAALALIDKSGRAGVKLGTGTRPSIGVNGKVSTKTNSIAWKEWPGTLIDLSSTGANVHLSLAAVAFPDDACRLKLSLGSYQLELPCTVAHFRCYSLHAVCGLLFNFPDPDTEKAYYQLLEPIMIGTSLVPVEAAPDRSGHHKEQYGGKNSALLTVWRQSAGAEVISFDFRMNDYGVRWRAGLTELSTYGVEKPGSNDHKDGARPVLKLKLKTLEKTTDGTQTHPLNEAQDEEVRWLFCLAVSNLSAAVAADVRKFLLSLVVA